MKHSVTVFCFLLLLGLTLEVGAMIRTLPLPELVQKAEFICIVEVVEKTEFASEGAKPQPMLKNVVKVVRSLKGEWNASDPLIFFTMGNLDGSYWVEDTPVFPAKGGKALVFFRKGSNGEPIFINAVQGLWPMNPTTDALQGMGFGKKLESVEEAIKAEKGP